MNRRLVRPISPNSAIASRAHAYKMLFLLLLLRPLGNVSLAWGMKHSARLIFGPFPFLRAILNPFVAGGVVLLVLALLVRMAMLSVADLSLVVPLTASGYILSTVLGRFILDEPVSSKQWIGTVLIFLGASFVTPKSAASTPLISEKFMER